MELKEIIKKRRSVRSFQDKKPPSLDEVNALARKCPSAGGIRGYQLFLTEKEIGPYGAPLYAVVCADPNAYIKRYGERGKDLYAVQDATIFGAYFQLLLADEGIDSVWIGAFREDRVKRDIGTSLRPVVILAIGYEK